MINPNLHELGVQLELKRKKPAWLPIFLTVHFLSAKTMMNDLACAFLMKGEKKHFSVAAFLGNCMHVRGKNPSVDLS